MDSTKSISFAQAWAHCASTGSYWIWMTIIIVLGVAAFIGLKAWGKKTNNDPSKALLVVTVVFTLALACAILGRPANVAANTSIEMAAKGHYLGY